MSPLSNDHALSVTMQAEALVRIETYITRGGYEDEYDRLQTSERQPLVWLTAGRALLGLDLPEQPSLFVAHALCGGDCLPLLDWRAVIERAVIAHHTLLTDAKYGGDHALHAHPRTYRRRVRGLEAPLAEGGPLSGDPIKRHRLARTHAGDGAARCAGLAPTRAA